MDIYKRSFRTNQSNYRKIYKTHHGTIPKDADGRSYDIHHIDGDYKNNELSNLKAVSLREHYDIHYAQGDWAACLLIAKRMKLSSEILSELSSNSARNRITAGTHHFIDSNWQSQNQKRLVEEGRHNFSGGEIGRQTQQRLVKEGTHNFLGENGVSKQRIKAGTHHFLGDSNPVYQLVKNGTHPWLAENGGSEKARAKAIKLIKDGNHHFINKNPNNTIVTCPHCGKQGSKPGMKTWHFDKCKNKS